MRVRLARRARGLTQQQLAGMAGMARQTLSVIESGLSDPSLRNALALARVLDVEVETLRASQSCAINRGYAGRAAGQSRG